MLPSPVVLHAIGRDERPTLPGFVVQSALLILEAEGTRTRRSLLAEAADSAAGERLLFQRLQELSLSDRAGAIGLRVGQRIVEPNLHAVGVMVAASRSMHEAYSNSVGVLEPMQFPPFGTLEVHGARAAYVLRRTDLGEFVEDLLLSLTFHLMLKFLASTQSAVANLTGQVEVSFARSAPAQIEEYERCFCGRVSFAAARTQLTFPLAFLELQRPGVDAALAADLRGALQRHIEVLDRESWADRVTGLLRRRAVLAQVDFEAIGRQVGLTHRSLRRRIASEGTSLSRILDEVRLERASHLLRESTAPLAQIAEALGYADEKSFRRAFKRVAGATPGEFRARLP